MYGNVIFHEAAFLVIYHIREDRYFCPFVRLNELFCKHLCQSYKDSDNSVHIVPSLENYP